MLDGEERERLACNEEEELLTPSCLRRAGPHPAVQPPYGAHVRKPLVVTKGLPCLENHVLITTIEFNPG
jgi:hypothetical protein